MNRKLSMRILIVEDEQDIAKPLKRSLEKRGFAVDYAQDGEEGINLAQINRYDCILLDLNLPKVNGIEVAKKLRNAQDTTPIIIVTARSQIYNKLEGFESGADDYVTKPFDLDELIARIKTIIKRSSLNKTLKLKFLEFELLPDLNKVFECTNGKKIREIELSNKETGILEYLLRNKGKIVSAEELLEHVWDREVDLFTQTVKTHIKTLRKKIDPKREIIKTIRGKGYLVKS